MEAEYIALRTSLKQLIPFKRLVQSVWNTVGFKQDTLISINTIGWEHNQGCKILANLKISKNYTKIRILCNKISLVSHSTRTQ